MIGHIARAGIVAVGAVAFTASVATAHTIYDGRWSLSITTQNGACDPSYTFPFDITNGRVSFPGLVHANGRVTAKGSVQVTVVVPGKSASGSGRLTSGSGSGRWSGKAGDSRCSGTWSAQKI